MSGNLPMRRREENAKVRYSAAYPTGAERIVKMTPLPWGLTPLYYSKTYTEGSDPFELELVIPSGLAL